MSATIYTLPQLTEKVYYLERIQAHMPFPIPLGRLPEKGAQFKSIVLFPKRTVGKNKLLDIVFSKISFKVFGNRCFYWEDNMFTDIYKIRFEIIFFDRAKSWQTICGWDWLKRRLK